MTASGEMLLNLLGSTVRAYTPDPVAAGQSASSVDAAFAELLSQASTGEMVTGLPVAVDPVASVALDQPLSADEIAALSQIADRAASQGADTVSVLRDDTVLTLDVESRRVTDVDMVSDQPIPAGSMIASLPERYDHTLGLPGTLLSLTPDSFDAGLGSVNMNASLRALLGGAAS